MPGPFARRRLRTRPLHLVQHVAEHKKAPRLTQAVTGLAVDGQRPAGIPDGLARLVLCGGDARENGQRLAFQDAVAGLVGEVGGRLGVEPARRRLAGPVVRGRETDKRCRLVVPGVDLAGQVPRGAPDGFGQERRGASKD